MWISLVGIVDVAEADGDSTFGLPRSGRSA
jgi:hypothetical protein